jgi:hypothetical protein
VGFRLPLQDARALVIRGYLREGARVHQPKARNETCRKARFYVALGLVTAATLMLQIIETRIISVTSWYYLAFFVISIAMFGLTAGAVFVYLRTKRFSPERLSYDLAVAALAFALTTDLAILVQLTLVTGASPSVTSLVGHPVYALSVVLFSLILWTGFGSMASESVRLAGAGMLVAWSVASAAYLFALPFWLPALLVDLDGADLLVRAGLCVLVLAPAAFLMGFGFPTGMRLVSAISTGPTPWFWGINGAAGVMAASVAVVTSIAFSIDTTLRIGAACYLLIAAPGVLLVCAGAPPSRTAQ